MGDLLRVGRHAITLRQARWPRFAIGRSIGRLLQRVRVNHGRFRTLVLGRSLAVLGSWQRSMVEDLAASVGHGIVVLLRTHLLGNFLRVHIVSLVRSAPSSFDHRLTVHYSQGRVRPTVDI